MWLFSFLTVLIVGLGTLNYQNPNLRKYVAEYQSRTSQVPLANPVNYVNYTNLQGWGEDGADLNGLCIHGTSLPWNERDLYTIVLIDKSFKSAPEWRRKEIVWHEMAHCYHNVEHGRTLLMAKYGLNGKSAVHVEIMINDYVDDLVKQYLTKEERRRSIMYREK